MPCRPLMCCHAPDCADHLCEGHPVNLGYESADPELVKPPRVAVPLAVEGPYRRTPKPGDWKRAAAKYVLLVVVMFALAAMSPANPFRFH
jgi:hypothetical protein